MLNQGDVVINDTIKLSDASISVSLDKQNDSFACILEVDKFILDIKKIKCEMFTLEDCEILNVLIGNKDRAFAYTVSFEEINIEDEYLAR